MYRPLLPSGLFDYLPPLAERESGAVGVLLGHFRRCGYAQVHPPLMEYEETLLDGAAGSLATRSFRVMDPLSQRMMAIRADMTMQIARIAGTLLKDEPRPLRLCYAGQTVRTTPDALRATRQFRQIGLELFGAESVAANVEVIQTAVAAVKSLGLDVLSVDLNLPQMMDSLALTLSPEDKNQLIEAVRRKDSAAIAAFNIPLATELANIAGGADEMLTRLQALGLPGSLAAQVSQLKDTCELLHMRLGDSLTITIDPLEMRGFGYYTGLRFSLFLKDKGLEIGRGGHYRTAYDEAATGFTLYTEDLLPFIVSAPDAPRLLLPVDTHEDVAAFWRAKGYMTIYASSRDINPKAEAKAMKISYMLSDDKVVGVQN